MKCSDDAATRSPDEGDPAPTDFLTTLLAGCEEALADGSSVALHRGLALFARAVLLDETRPEPHLGLAFCYSNLGDDDRGVRHFDLCLTLGFGSGEFSELVYEYEDREGDAWAVEIGLEQVLVWRAGCYLSLHRERSARIDLQRLADSDVPEVRAQSALLWAKIQLDAGALDAAQRQLSLALALDPEHPDAHFVRGRIHECSGRLSAALKAYDRAIRLDAESAEFRVARARVRLAAGDFGLAETDLRVAQTLVAQQLPQPELSERIEEMRGQLGSRT